SAPEVGLYEKSHKSGHSSAPEASFVRKIAQNAPFEHARGEICAKNRTNCTARGSHARCSRHGGGRSTRPIRALPRRVLYEISYNVRIAQLHLRMTDGRCLHSRPSPYR